MLLHPQTLPSHFGMKKLANLVKSHIVPNAHLEWQNKIELHQPQAETSLRIAHIGYPVKHKGWATFLSLAEQFRNKPKYKFYLFSSSSVRRGNFKCVNVSVTKKNRNRMVQELSNYNIDVAILWSSCPETFSFTMYEALAAGCFILTNPLSGNIQDYIKKNPMQGLVLDNEQRLFDLFASHEIEI